MKSNTLFTGTMPSRFIFLQLFLNLHMVRILQKYNFKEGKKIKLTRWGALQVEGHFDILYWPGVLDHTKSTSSFSLERISIFYKGIDLGSVVKEGLSTTCRQIYIYVYRCTYIYTDIFCSSQ